MKRSTFNKESSTSDSKLPMASANCQLSCLVMVEDACVKAKYLPHRHPLQLSDRYQTVQDPREFDMVPNLFDASIEIPRKGMMRISPRLDVMENDRSFGIVVVRASERSLGSWSRVRACQPTTEKKRFISRHSSRLQLDPICKRSKVASRRKGSTCHRERKGIVYVGNVCGLYSREDYRGDTDFVETFRDESSLSP